MRTTTKNRSATPTRDGAAAADSETSSKHRTKTRPEPDFLTVADVAAKLCCSTKSIRRRIKAGLIKAKYEGGRLIIARGDYYAYVVSLG